MTTKVSAWRQRSRSNMLKIVFFLLTREILFDYLSLSHKEHGWAHGSNTVYSVIHDLTGTSIELQSPGGYFDIFKHT